MNLVAEIEQAWGWVGINPEQIIGENEFGNLIIKDIDGRYWRLCPEDLYCKVVANDRTELDALSQDQEFLRDWHMSALVAEAKSSIGPLTPGRKYCLKIPGVLGGAYEGANIASVPFTELIAMSGHIAKEIHDLPDGSKVRFKFTD